MHARTFTTADAVWLVIQLGLTFGTAALQHAMFQQAQDPDNLRIVVFATAAGALGMMWQLSQRRRLHTATPGQLLHEVLVDHERYAWQHGSTTRAALVLSFTQPTVFYAVLFTPLLLALSDGTSIPEMGKVIPFVIMWTVSIAALWVPTWHAQLRSQDQLKLTADAHSIVVERASLLGNVRSAFAAWNTEIAVETGDAYGQLRLTTDAQTLSMSIPSDAEPGLEALARVLEPAPDRQENGGPPADLEALRYRN